MRPSGIIRWGGIAAMIGGALWVVWGLLSRAIPYAAGGPSEGGLLRLSAGVLLLAALLTLGGLVGLDALQGGSHWNVGRVGFYTAAVGLLAQALAAVFLLGGSEALLWLLAPGGAWQWWSGWRSTGPPPCKLGCWRLGAGGRSS